MITERILELLNYKGITKYKFCKDLGFSNGFLDKPREITTEKYANILEYFKDVNPNWLLTGKGEMIKKEETCADKVNKGREEHIVETINNLSATSNRDSTSIAELIETTKQMAVTADRMAVTADRNSRTLEKLVDMLQKLNLADSLELKKWEASYSNIKGNVELTGKYMPVT